MKKELKGDEHINKLYALINSMLDYETGLKPLGKENMLDIRNDLSKIAVDLNLTLIDYSNEIETLEGDIQDLKIDIDDLRDEIKELENDKEDYTGYYELPYGFFDTLLNTADLEVIKNKVTIKDFYSFRDIVLDSEFQENLRMAVGE